MEGNLYELLLLTKSGREILIGTGQSEEEVKNLAQAAEGLLGGLKGATEGGNLAKIESNGNTYWILPSEIEGITLFKAK